MNSADVLGEQVSPYLHFQMAYLAVIHYLIHVVVIYDSNEIHKRVCVCVCILQYCSSVSLTMLTTFSLNSKCAFNIIVVKNSHP